MKLIDMMLVSLYLHFVGMKDKGRSVVPWFSTCVAISLFMAISGGLVLKLIMGPYFNNKIAEPAFLAAFLLVGVLCFFSIKIYFFNSGKHIDLSEIYIKKYSSKKRFLYKAFSISILLILPLILGFIIWLKAKPI